MPTGLAITAIRGYVNCVNITMIVLMLKIKRPAGLSNNPLNILPYLPDEEGFFDSRHWTFGGIHEALPFSVTTRISANNQQFLKVHG